MQLPYYLEKAYVSKPPHVPAILYAALASLAANWSVKSAATGPSPSFSTVRKLLLCLGDTIALFMSPSVKSMTQKEEDKPDTRTRGDARVCVGLT